MGKGTHDLVENYAEVGRWRGALVSVLAGLGLALGQVPFGFFWLAVPALSLVFFTGYSSRNARQAAWRGWVAGFAFSALSMSWIVEPFFVDIERDGWMAPFALVFMSAGFGVFWALAFWLARRVGARGSMALALSLPVFWTASEIFRSYAFTGFPWGLTSYIWINSPVYQMASFLGPHGVTLATGLLAVGLMVAVLQKNWVVTPGIVGLFGLAYLGGNAIQNLPVPGEDGTRPVVRLIQPNADQKSKWDPAMMPVFYSRQIALTSEKAERPVDLVVWPEVAVPFLLSDPGSPFWEISAAANDVPVVLGAQRLDGFRAYNSLAVLGPGGEIEEIYDKYHLVPFGEYIPGEWILSRIGLKAMTAKYGTGYTAGPGPRVLDLGPLGKALPLICYEAIFPHEIRRVSERPDWMLMVTNDAWFGEAFGPYQHFAQARARAIEMALPMVRAANTGISAVIDARGRVVKSLPLGTSGRLDVDLPPSLPPSLYWKTGDTPVMILLIVLAFAALQLNRRNAIDHGNSQG